MDERRRLDRRATDVVDVLVSAGGGSAPSQLYDQETGLATRALFRDRTEHALKRAERNADRVALVLLEIEPASATMEPKRDRCSVSKAVVQRVRPQDTVAWLDEGYVGILVEGVANTSGAQGMRCRLEDTLPRCRASSVAVSDSHGRIGLWL